MKRINIIAASLCISLAANAVPAKPGIRTFTQPDGSTISLELVGDENSHAFVTSDGLAVRPDDQGTFRYLTADGLTSVVAHDPADRSADEQTFVSSRSADIEFLSVASQRVAAYTNSPARARANAAQQQASQVPQTGSPRIPILLVQYADVKFRDGNNALQTFTDFFESGTKSARQYFVDQSNGKYTPEFEVFGPITLSGKRQIYGANDYYGTDKGIGKMVAEACTGLNSSVNFKDYDNDGDGVCDVVIILYAGAGEASSGIEESIWPCQWDLRSSDYGKTLSLDDTTILKFAVFNERHNSDSGGIDGIGTFAHEFSHCLNLPDFYDTKYGGHFGMSYWSLLDTGCYNDDGYTPIGYSAYEKNFMGWLDLPEATPETFYTLPVLNQKSEATDVAYRITNDADKNEYYIVENRAKQGWDKYIKANGLLIYHVTYDSSAWTSNTVNNYDLQRMTPIPADGNLNLNNLSGDLWPYKTATELTDKSSPAAKVNTGGYMGKPITEITRNDDGSVSFWFCKAPVSALEAPVITDPLDVTTTSFTAAWRHTTDIPCTYTLEVSNHVESSMEQVIDSDFTVNDLDGWEADSSTYVEYDTKNNALRLGSTSKNGAIESETFSTDASGYVTVTVRARSYSSDNSPELKIYLLNMLGMEIESKTFNIGKTEAEYTWTFDGPASSIVYIRIETTMAKKRVLLSHVSAWLGNVSSAISSKASEGSYTFSATDITAKQFTVSGMPTGGTFDYRVRAVPIDLTQAGISSWSQTATITLDPTGVENVDIDSIDATAEVYNLQGIRMDASALTPGVYVRRTGSKVEKILVK